MVSVKEQVLQAINRLPDDIDSRDAADEIAFLAAVREAERDIEQGRVITNEQMKTRIGEWSDWGERHGR
jgi:predicted transcriptional regulator